MVIASDLHVGLVARIEGVLYRVIEVTRHAGQGKMGGFTHAKLRHLETGTIRESRFHPNAPIEDLTPERHSLQFLYRDDRFSHFMHPETFEQVDIENTRLGPAAVFVAEAMTIPVEFVDGCVIGIVMPDVVDIRVTNTTPPARSHGGTNVWKEAMLETGVTIMVPPFIAPGEMIRVNVAQGMYVERTHKK